MSTQSEILLWLSTCKRDMIKLVGLCEQLLVEKANLEAENAALLQRSTASEALVDRLKQSLRQALKELGELKERQEIVGSSRSGGFDTMTATTASSQTLPSVAQIAPRGSSGAMSENLPLATDNNIGVTDDSGNGMFCSEEMIQTGTTLACLTNMSAPTAQTADLSATPSTVSYYGELESFCAEINAATNNAGGNNTATATNACGSGTMMTTMQQEESRVVRLVDESLDQSAQPGIFVASSSSALDVELKQLLDEANCSSSADLNQQQQQEIIEGNGTLVVGARRSSISSSGCKNEGGDSALLSIEKQQLLLSRSTKPHVCTVCGRAFTRSADLRRHFRLHTGEKPYICDYCGKKFSDNSNKIAHVRMHHERRNSCQFCPKNFRSLNARLNHERLHHSRASQQQLQQQAPMSTAAIVKYEESDEGGVMDASMLQQLQAESMKQEAIEFSGGDQPQAELTFVSTTDACTSVPIITAQLDDNGMFSATNVTSPPRLTVGSTVIVSDNAIQQLSSSTDWNSVLTLNNVQSFMQEDVSVAVSDDAGQILVKMESNEQTGQ